MRRKIHRIKEKQQYRQPRVVLGKALKKNNNWRNTV